MNQINPSRNKSEYYIDNKETINIKNRKYWKDNKEHLNMKQREYHEKHKEEINLKRSVTYPCLCGCSYTLRHKARHEKSKKHQEFIQQIITE